MHTIYRPWFQTDFSASWVSLLVHCPVSDSLNSQSLPLSTLCLASAGNSSLVLFFHPVLEYPVTMEHDALVAEEENFGWKINSPTRQPAIFVFPLCVSYAWPTASNSDAPLKIYKLSFTKTHMMRKTTEWWSPGCPRCVLHCRARGRDKSLQKKKKARIEDTLLLPWSLAKRDQ